MPVTRRSRVFAATPDEVWDVVGDPHRLASWWPRVQRVERVSDGAFTEVLTGRSGRPVRADFHLTALEPPTRVAWAQDVEGTPFEGVLEGADTAVELAPDGDGRARVTLVLDQRMRGLSRLGGMFVRRASRRLLDEALDGLEQRVVVG
jgi:carbon monoxide dehydrogenase subunit G